ncbi:unnamed protein product [Rotaria sordida]|uniref:Uncharacterized protein n=1 Tax=Rotaria sordida TaxID=392033 RepID=A0A815HHD3_9BILA|nr:unnamed protein product [Rotaria sordida]CAF1601702.1 unnamed protein product [Rotaria sordida]
MFLLDDRETIEKKLLHILSERIINLNLDRNIRRQLIYNIYKFSSYFFPVDINTIVHPRFFNYESDEESDVDDVTDDSTSDEDDFYDDIENQILDYFDFEQFIAAMSDTSSINHPEYQNNNNNNNFF